MMTKSRMSWFGLVLALMMMCPRVSPADSRSYKTTGTLDWVMVEERRPYLSAGNWSPFLGTGYPVISDEGASFDFYTGVGNTGTGSSASCFWHWSTWPISKPVQATDTVKLSHLGTTTWGHDSDGGEGTSAGLDGLPVFGIKANVWYRFAIRCWRPADGTPHKGYAGQWVREETTGVWYHCGTFETPFAIQGVRGLGGFIEGYPPYDGFRAIHFRNAFVHEYGQPPATIQRANQITINWNKGAGYAGLIENDTAAMAWQQSNQTGKDPMGERYPDNVGEGLTLTMKNQPAPPPFDPIVVTGTSAMVLGQQLLVKWDLPATSSPQLSYKIEVFNNPGCTGPPVLTWMGREPATRQKLLSIPGTDRPQVRLTISDIFENVGTPVLITPTPAQVSPAHRAVRVVNGLNYKYYEAAKGAAWSSVPDFKGMKPLRQGAVNFIDTTPRQRRSGYAFDYSGYFQAPRDGLYSFSLSSYDSSRLFIDGVEVVNFDGLHQRAEKSGGVALQAGLHAVSVQYAFSEQRGQTLLWDDVSLKCEGPGIARVEMPPAAWFRVADAGEPSITLASPAPGSIESGAAVSLTLREAMNRPRVNKVQYYLESHFLGEASAAPFEVKVLLGAAQANLIRARAFYGEGCTLDSPQSTVTTIGTDVSPWHFTPLEYHYYPGGASVQGSTLTMIGDSLNLLTQQVTGDFTFTAHLASITPKTPGPDGTPPESDWRAGIIVRGNTDLTVGEPLGNGKTTRSTELFCSVGGGTYFEDDTMRGGNGDANLWSADVGGDHRWFKIVRAGDGFTSSVSKDGVKWTQVRSSTLAGMGATPHVGMFIHAPQSMNPSLFTATLDNVNLTVAPGTKTGPP